MTPGRLNSCATNVVRYGAGICEDEDLKQYLALLADARGEEVERWPADEQLCFYLNAYNALCLHHVVRYMREQKHHRRGGGHPLTQLTQIPSRTHQRAGQRIWDMDAGVVAGRRCSLNDIEHGIIRAR